MAKDFADTIARMNAGSDVKETATAETCADPRPNPSPEARTSKHTRENGQPVATRPTKPSAKPRQANLSATAGDCGQKDVEAHVCHAAVSNILAQAGSGEGQKERETQSTHADPDLIDTIREQWRNRQGWVRAQVRLTLQCDALCRRLVNGEKEEASKLRMAVEKGKPHELADVALAAIGPILNARDALLDQQKQLDKELAKLAKKLPGYDYVRSCKGAGDLYFVGIVGEAGDIGSYKSVSALWKRMGLAVIGDGRQRRVSGVDALDHGYNPERRAHMWVMGDCMIRAQVRKSKEEGGESTAIGHLGQLYLDRKAYEADRVETKKHAHHRAKRYIEKRFLRELYATWRGGHVIIENQGDHAAL